MALKLSGLSLVGALLAAAAFALTLAPAAPRARAATGGWTAEYFNNMTLTGAPVLVREEGPYLDLYRAGTAPAPGVNIEHFSARWTRTDNYIGGTYRIAAAGDDGIRVYVDGALVIDAWYDQEITTYTTDVPLSAGTHSARVEYYNNFLKVAASVWIERLAPATAVPTTTDVPAAAPTGAPPATGTPFATRTVAPTRTAGALSTPPQATATLAVTVTPPATASPTATPTPGGPPHIECLWALPDMNSDVAGIQYVPGPADDVHDHDMAVVPDADNDPANGVQPPCAGPPDTPPLQPDGVRHLMQVVPNLEDQPEQRRIQLWLAVDDPAGGGPMDAFWYVYYPDGSAVGGVASTLVPVAGCTEYGAASGPVGSMFEAAVHTGQIAPAAAGDPALGLIARCQLGTKRIYHGEFQLSKDQPCGEYGITAVAVTGGGATATLTASLDVLCVVAVKVDFNIIDWGTLAAGYPKIVGGDMLFAPPNDTWPSVKNVGNDGMGLKLKFSAMTGASFGQIIDEFHACFGRSPSTLQCISPIAADALASFDADPARTLCANELGKLDLAVHPPGSVPADLYRGIATLIGYHIADRCAGNRHLP